MVKHFPSASFLAALAGVGFTLLAWYGPWAWPAWPAFAVMDLAFGSRHNFAELSYRARSIWVVCLIAINVAFWALALLALRRGIGSLRRAARR